MIAGIYLSLIGKFKHLDTSALSSAAAYLSFSLFLTIIGAVIIIKFFPKSSIWRNISLDGTQLRDKGFISARDYSHYLGKEGQAVSMLRPAGIGLFDGERLDVVSEGDFIDKDTPIVISQIDGYRLIVKRIEKKA